MLGLRKRLSKAHPLLFSVFAGTAAFCAYFSMYAFRKPFTAATYHTVADWTFALDFKVVLVIAQLAGYALSKLIGIKVISELGREGRATTILALIAASWLSLVAFALLPTPWNIAALFLNGLPLGLIWGLVFSYLEGRRTSELMGAILCASFILSSGVVKAVGKMLLQAGVGEFWMPAATGLVFTPLLIVSVIGLTQLPPPDDRDEAERVKRAPMDAAQRIAFLRRYGLGMGLLVLSYVLFTAFRDFRDNFAAEIWTALGYGDVSSVFAATEVPVAAAALAAMAALMVIKDNIRAFLAMHWVVFGGAALIGLSTFAHQSGLISPVVWMVLTGAGLYIAYTPFNAMLFDRMIAATRQVGTAGFLIYLADASGYLGSVVLLLVRNLLTPRLDWVGFFTASAYFTSIVGGLLTVLSGVYFTSRLRGASGRAKLAMGDPAAAE